MITDNYGNTIKEKISDFEFVFKNFKEVCILYYYFSNIYKNLYSFVILNSDFIDNIQSSATTKKIDDMSLNCAVQLQRFDASVKTNNATINSKLSKNTSVNNETKKITRTARKRNFKSLIVDDNNYNQPDNVKKKKCLVTKPLSSKDESGKLSPEIILQKSTKKTKSHVSTSIKSTKNNNSTNSDFSKMPDTVPSINLHADDATISMQSSSLKKSPKKKTSIKKKSILTNVHKNDTSNELEINDNIVLSKTPKKRIYSKSTTSNKNKSVVCNINIDNTLKNELEKNDNIVLSKSSKNKTPKLYTLKNKSVVKSINKGDIVNKLEGSDDSAFSRKRRSTSKKVQSQKTDTVNSSNNGVNLPKIAVVLEKLQFIPVSKSSEKIDDNTMMLRSNNKPPKIKKKWSEEWSGDKLSNMLKSNNDDSLNGQKIDANNCSKLIKKAIKNQKPKNANYKKLKTKMLEKLNTNINNSNACENDTTVNFPGMQVHDNNNINSIPRVPSSVPNIVISEPVNTQIGNNDSCNIITTNSSEVNVQPSIVPTTYTEMSISTLSYENYQQSRLKPVEPISDSNIILSLPIITSECPEISYGISILSEAISRQHDELANKNNKLNSEKQDIIKTNSEEHDVNKIDLEKHDTNSSKQDINEFKSQKQDINEINSSKKTNNPRLQVPSAAVSPQRVYRNMSRKVIKYSLELCEQSSENDSQLRLEHEIDLLSRRFNIPIACLKKTVLEEPLSVFQKKYSEPATTPSMVTVSPIEKIETKSQKNKASGSLDIKYSLEPIRERMAYEKTNLIDLMTELTKTMPSWSLSIVANPSRYLIAHMTVNTHGVPYTDKCIILDKSFRASVYLNQCLKHEYSKQYTTSTEIINLIKVVNAIEFL